MRKVLFLAICLLAAIVVRAQANVEFTAGDLKYKFNSTGTAVSCIGLSNAAISAQKQWIEIPGTVTYSGSNYSVAEVVSSAFANNSFLTNVVVKAGVKKVGKSAFSGCQELAQVTLSCDTIKGQAFEGCASLYSITLNEGVRIIEGRAFASTDISSLTLPASAISVNPNLCDGCLNFTSFAVASGNTSYSAANDLLFNKQGSTLIRVPVAKDPFTWFEKDIPTNLTSLGAMSCANNIYSGTSSKYVQIPPSVKTIANFVFQNSDLGEVVIPSSVTSIGSYAFSNSTVSNITTGSATPLSIDATVFNNCELKRLCVPVNTWSSYASAPYWKNFQTIKTGGYDFYNYYSTTKGDFIVTQQPTSTTRGKVKMVYGTRDADWTVYIPTSVYCPANGLTYDVVALSDSCFAGNSRLSTANMPSEMTSVPRRAFENCVNLKTVNMVNSTSIGDSAFYNCSSLTTVNFAEHTRRIGNYAFYNSGITGTVNLHDALYACAIGNYAFYNCSNMTELIFFGSSIGNNAFGGPSMKNSFRCYVMYPYTTTRRNDAASWVSGNSWAPSRILPYFASDNTSMILSMPDKITNAVHLTLPIPNESGDTKYFAVTGFSNMFDAEFNTKTIDAGTGIRAGEGILVTDITPGKIYRMNVPSSTPTAIAGNLLVGNPYPRATSVTREDGSYYYYFRPDNKDFYRYYNDFSVAFGGGYLRDTGKHTQSTIVDIDAMCYPLMVASTRVKPENAANITSSYIKSGTAVYDPDENVLTLNNIKIETGSSTGGLIANIPDLTIILNGNNTMTMTGDNNYYTGLRLEESSGVTITGSGSLTLGGGHNGNSMFLNTHQPVDSVMLTIKDCTVNASPFSDDYEENLTVDNATLRGTQLSIGRTLVLKNCYIAKPQGAGFEYGMLTVDGQYYYGDFEILPGEGGIRGDINGDGAVNTGDVSALYAALLSGSTDSKYDLNGDGSVNSGDVSELYKIIIGM